MNISNETSKKILQLLNQPEAFFLKEKMKNVDPNVILEMFKQINPSESDIKKAEEKISAMSKDELMAEIMKKMKG